MKIHHILLFCFLSAALCGGNTGLVSAKLNIYTGAEGGNGTIYCLLTSGSRKFFCKEQCKEEDILIKTDDVASNNGRYSVKYQEGSSGRGILSVTITNLTKSDSGRYRCGLGSSLVPDSYSDFEVRVSDELLDRNSGFILTSVEGETFRKPCFDEVNKSRFFFCKDECKKEEDILIETDQKSSQMGRYSIEYKEGSALGLYVNISHVTKSDTGRYKCGYGRALSPDSSYTFSVIVIDAPTTSKPNWTFRPFSTSASKAIRTASLTSSSESATILPVFSETTGQPAAAALTTSKPNWNLQPFSPSVPSTSSTTTTLSLSFSSGSSSLMSVLPETKDQPAAAAPTTSKPNRTLRPPSTSVLSASSATTTQSLSSSSGSSTPSSVFPETTNQAAAAALTTSKPTQTSQPLSTSVPSTSLATTTTQSLSSSSESSTTVSSPENTNQAFSYVPRPDNVLPLAVCVPLVGVLLLGAFLLLLHIWKTKKNTDQ